MPTNAFVKSGLEFKDTGWVDRGDGSGKHTERTVLARQQGTEVPLYRVVDRYDVVDEPNRSGWSASTKESINADPVEAKLAWEQAAPECTQALAFSNRGEPFFDAEDPLYCCLQGFYNDMHFGKP